MFTISVKNIFTSRSDHTIRISAFSKFGMLDKYLDQSQVHINKLIAQKDIVFSNSMVEVVNKQMKYAYLFTQDFRFINKPFAF